MNRRIVFNNEEENNSVKVADACGISASEMVVPGTSTGHSNTNENATTTGLLAPDPNREWIGGVECRLLNKFGPQCSQEHPVKSNLVGDGIHLSVEADDLDYVDDVPNLQDPDNERLAETLDMEIGELDDSDGLEQGATASNIEEVQILKVDKAMSKRQRDELLKQNPALRTLLSDLLDEKLKDIDLIQGGTVTIEGNTGKVKYNNNTLAAKNNGKKSKGNEKQIPHLKSPSDTTIYAPALKLRNQPDHTKQSCEVVKDKVE